MHLRGVVIPGCCLTDDLKVVFRLDEGAEAAANQFLIGPGFDQTPVYAPVV